MANEVYNSIIQVLEYNLKKVYKNDKSKKIALYTRIIITLQTLTIVCTVIKSNLYFTQSLKMRAFLKCVFIIVLIVNTGFINLCAQVNNDRNIYLADPTIFYHKGTYYLYGTVEGNANQGFLVYTSADMKNWKVNRAADSGYALRKGNAYGTANFWAPQVFFYKNKFYMAYVANENIAIAESKSPLGPFTQKIKQPLAAAVKQIDPFIFIDGNGKKYLYHVRLSNGNKLYVAEMSDAFSAIKPETLHECITATEPWENTAHTSWPVTEGPSVLKHKNLYYLFYTANDFRNPDYAVGYAVSNHPNGPWKKYAANPVISKDNIGESGTGHGDFIKDNHKNIFYVFHTHNSDSVVAPRKTAIIKVSFSKDTCFNIDKLTADKETFFYLKKRL